LGNRNDTVMKAIFEIAHPAHVHLFKNTMWNLQDCGWQLKIVVRPREITLYLLNAYGFGYEKLNYDKGLLRKVCGIFPNDAKYLKIARNFSPDLFVGTISPYSAQVSALLRKPYIAFDDTNPQKSDLVYMASYFLTLPFTDVMCTPSNYTFPVRLNTKKHLRYRGYHELAYLHPEYFKPDPGVLKQLNLSEKDNFIILRFASLDAIHDIGQRGFRNVKEILEFVQILQSHCKILITSEINIPGLEKYKIKLPAEKIHHLLAFATAYVGEGATMASEAGVLGVPWVFIYSKRLCYLDDQEEKYGLGYTVNNSIGALKIALNFLKNPNLRKEWAEKRVKMLNDKIDVTHFMTELIKGYPKSADYYRKENQNLQ
jgi:predicted glycosyltransferase